MLEVVLESVLFLRGEDVVVDASIVYVTEKS